MIRAVAPILCLGALAYCAGALAQDSKESTRSVDLYLWDKQGRPCIGCKLTIYRSGTSTPVKVSRAGQNNAGLSNPLIVEPNGELHFSAEPGPYNVRLENAAGTELWSRNGISQWTDLDTAIALDSAQGSSRIQTAAQAKAGVPDAGTTVKSPHSFDVRDFGARGDGKTDDGPAINAAIIYVQTHFTGGCLYFSSGIYYTTTTITVDAPRDGPLCIHGAGYVVDSRLGNWKNVAVISSIANPIMQISPYPGVTIEGFHFEGRGTSTCTEVYDAEKYCKQIALWVGNIGKPLMTTASGDKSNAGGSGGLKARYLSFAGANNTDAIGKGIYAYKLWGVSTISDLFFSRIGRKQNNDADDYSAIELTGETVDTRFYNVHIIGDNLGTAIKVGSSKKKTDALKRFYTPAAHLEFHSILIEGSGDFVYNQYSCVSCSITNGQYGGSYSAFRVGEDPSVNFRANNALIVNGASSFKLQRIDLTNSTNVSIRDWVQEGDGRTVMPIRYWMSSPTVTGKNISLVPMFDRQAMNLLDPKAADWLNTPVALSEGQGAAGSAQNLCPSFFSAEAGSGKVLAPFVARLDPNGKIAVTTKLKPNTVYTAAFFLHSIGGANLLQSRYQILDAKGATIVDNGFHNSTIGANQQAGRIVQFRTGSGGAVKLQYANNDTQGVIFGLPYVLEGAHASVNYFGTVFDALMNLSPPSGKFLYAPVGEKAFIVRKTGKGAPNCSSAQGCWWIQSVFGEDVTVPIENGTSQRIRLFQQGSSLRLVQSGAAVGEPFRGPGVTETNLSVEDGGSGSSGAATYRLPAPNAKGSPDNKASESTALVITNTGANLAAISEGSEFYVWGRVELR